MRTIYKLPIRWLLLVLAMAWGGAAWAAWLDNVPVTVVQPNGDTLHLFATGDEFYHYVHDADGYTILQHPVTGYYVYAVKTDNKLVASNYVYGTINPSEKGIRPRLTISDEEYFQRRREWDRLHTYNVSLNRSPNTNRGNINHIVIFISFVDDPIITNSFSDVDYMFNSTTTGARSVYNYFKTVSYDKTHLVSSYYPTPEGSQIVSYVCPIPKAYYQPHSLLNLLGYQDDTERREREIQLLNAAIAYVNSNYPIPNSLNIDYNNDDIVDIITFAVNTDVDGWGDLFWPHEWWFDNDTQVRINGKKPHLYTFELLKSNRFYLNTFCHELTHVFGAPDFYHSKGIQDYPDNPDPLGRWDIMCGSANNGFTGQEISNTSAYIKWKYLNWIDEIPTITQPGVYTLQTLSSHSTQNANAYKIASSNPNQYYVLEYRDNTVLFDENTYGKGLVIYRVNEESKDYNGDGEEDYQGNLGAYPAQGMYDELYVFRPGGTLTNNGQLSQAFFSSESGRVRFNQSTNPSPCLSDGTPDRSISIFDISEAGNTISFTYGYKIEVSSNIIPGGTVTGGGLFAYNSTCTVTATPNLGYAFHGWYKSVLGVPTIKVSDDPCFTFAVSENRNLIAKFLPANYTITLNALPTAGGTISGDGTYPAGSVVTVSAHANSGYRFNGWVENGEVVATSNNYMFNANSDRNLTATFVSTQSGIGSVVTNADGSQGVLYHFDASGVGWMVAMDEASEGCQWGPTTNVQLLPDRTCDNVVALEDLSGFRNTGLIRTELGTENDYAASQVDFDHGWYLPSAGQLRKLYSALPFIDSVLYQHGGSTISEDTYWSSTEYSSANAASPMFAMSNSSKSSNRRVRAIRNYYSPQDNTILAMPDSPTRGEVMNYHNGVYSYGENAAVVATPKPGYKFDHWSEEGLPVSYNHVYTFTFTHSRRLIAHFVVSGGIGTVIHNADGSDGVVFYVNTDGTEGLMVALEDASQGCQWGTNSNIIPLNDRPLNGISALEDVSGFHNTGLIRTAQNADSTVYAAGVVDYENGWYLPAAGELRKLYAALPLIETALVRAGGSTLTEGTYWSSTEYSTTSASTPMFSMGNTNKTSTCRVRAIRKFLPSGIHSLVAKSQDTIMGTASGSGTYDYNATVTVSAVANEGFVFESWTEDGLAVSYDATYQFPFTRNRVLVANFRVAGTVGEIVHNADGSTGVVFYQNAEGTEGWMVALEDASEGCQWGPTTNINAMPDMLYNDIRALEDVSGYRNTDLIRKVLGTNNDYAASVVDFDNGWYLPAAGQLRKLYAALPMIEESILNAGGTLLTEDAYWSSSEYNTSDAFSPMFAMSNASKTSSRRVRAIRTFNCSNTNVVRVMANNVAFGSVAGGGNYEIGASVSVLATPKPNYAFDHWEEDGCTVSYDRYYTFEFTRTRTLVAVFVRENSIGSIVHNADGSTGVIFYTYPSGIGGLMVALEDDSEGCPWGLNEDVTILDNQSPSAVMDLLEDMRGKSNTNRVRQWYSDNSEYAACKTDYANGWYLPSAGQLRKLYAALPIIEGAIVNAGGTTMTEDAYWSSTEQSASNAWTPSFAMSSSSKTGNCRVRAIRSLTDTETITANVNIEGSGIVTGAGWYDHGQTCTLKAQANESYAFLNWTHGGTVVSTKMEYSFTVLGNQTYTANFVANSSNITTAIEPANSGTVTGAGIYTIGSNCTLTATPHTGYSFVNWTKNGSVVSTNSSYGFTVAESAQYTAHFVINSYAVNATVFPEEGGTVSGAHAYTHGSTATLTATAAEGYTFVNWTENGAVVSTSPTLQFVVYGNRSLVANFSDNAYTVTTIVYPSDGGTVEGGGSYIHGMTATLTAYPNPQFEFFCWFENDDVLSFAPSVSFEVTEDHVIYAVFVENESVTQTVSLSAGTNWFSTYLEITKEDLQNALLDVLSNPTGAIIKSQDGNSTYRGGRWRDQNFVWDVAKMYMIVAPEDCEIALTGEPINPADHPITIAPNAPTWIGFPFAESKTPAQVIPAGFAVNGDIIKGMGGNIRYNNGSWRAQGMNILEPGQGYIYISKSAVSRTLIFPTSKK